MTFLFRFNIEHDDEEDNEMRFTVPLRSSTHVIELLSSYAAVVKEND